MPWSSWKGRQGWAHQQQHGQDLINSDPSPQFSSWHGKCMETFWKQNWATCILMNRQPCLNFYQGVGKVSARPLEYVGQMKNPYCWGLWMWPELDLEVKMCIVVEKQRAWYFKLWYIGFSSNKASDLLLTLLCSSIHHVATFAFNKSWQLLITPS